MKKSFNRLTAIVMAGTMAMSLAGCMPSASDTATTAAETTTAAADTAETTAAEPAAPSGMTVNTTDSITLRMNWWGGDNRHEATLEAIKAFEAKYPNIKVEAEYEAFSGHEEKVALALKSGNAADVIQLNMDWVFNYSPEGTMFLDLNTVSDIIDLTAYDQSDLDFFTTKGVLQALPVSNTGRVFEWNKTTFDKIGVALPTTLDELLAAGDAFAAFEDGSYYPIYLDELDRTHLMVYYLQCKYGKPWVTVENYELQYTLEEIEEGLEFINTLEDRHVTPTVEQIHGDGADTADTNPKFLDGHYAGVYMWDSNVNKYSGAVPDSEFAIGEMISMGDYHGGMTKASMVFAIPQTCAHPAEAAALIQFLFGDAEGATILGDTRGTPANKNALAAFEITGLAADAHTKAMDWIEFKFDPIFERAALKNTDGTYYMVMQMLSYEQDSVESIAQYLMDDINKQLDAAKQ